MDSESDCCSSNSDIDKNSDDTNSIPAKSPRFIDVLKEVQVAAQEHTHDMHASNAHSDKDQTCIQFDMSDLPGIDIVRDTSGAIFAATTARLVQRFTSVSDAPFVDDFLAAHSLFVPSASLAQMIAFRMRWAFLDATIGRYPKYEVAARVRLRVYVAIRQWTHWGMPNDARHTLQAAICRVQSDLKDEKATILDHRPPISPQDMCKLSNLAKLLDDVHESCIYMPASPARDTSKCCGFRAAPLKSLFSQNVPSSAIAKQLALVEQAVLQSVDLREVLVYGRNATSHNNCSTRQHYPSIAAAEAHFSHMCALFANELCSAKHPVHVLRKMVRVAADSARFLRNYATAVQIALIVQSPAAIINGKCPLEFLTGDEAFLLNDVLALSPPFCTAQRNANEPSPDQRTPHMECDYLYMFKDIDTRNSSKFYALRAAHARYLCAPTPCVPFLPLMLADIAASWTLPDSAFGCMPCYSQALNYGFKDSSNPSRPISTDHNAESFQNNASSSPNLVPWARCRRVAQIVRTLRAFQSTKRSYKHAFNPQIKQYLQRNQ